MGAACVKDSPMEQINNTIAPPAGALTWEAPEACEYDSHTCDISVENRKVSVDILKLHELPSRRWLIEALRC